jgi:hypothetical protein
MPPPVFLKKRLQAIENKRREREKETQERKRARKPLKTKGVPKWENLGCGLGSGKRRVPSVDTISRIWGKNTASVIVCQVGN